MQYIVVFILSLIIAFLTAEFMNIFLKSRNAIFLSIFSTTVFCLSYVIFVKLIL